MTEPTTHNTSTVESAMLEALAALKECTELLYHLNSGGKSPAQDAVTDALRERCLRAMQKFAELPIWDEAKNGRV